MCLLNMGFLKIQIKIKSDEDILDEVTGQSQNASEDEEENVHVDLPVKPKIEDVMNAIAMSSKILFYFLTLVRIL